MVHRCAHRAQWRAQAHKAATFPPIAQHRAVRMAGTAQGDELLEEREDQRAVARRGRVLSLGQHNG